MRIRILQRPVTTSIDGVRLDGFEPGVQYEVGTSIGALLLAEGWAEPVPNEETAHANPVNPFLRRVAFAVRTSAPDPPNLLRDTNRPYLADARWSAADFERRRDPGQSGRDGQSARPPRKSKP